jgi:hypothetical protein
MLLKEYGALIDQHDAVIRINVLENAKFYANLGKETTYRVHPALWTPNLKPYTLDPKP